MIIIKLIHRIFLTFLFFAVAGCANTQLQKGVDAYNQGKYNEAAKYWNPLAKEGNPHAQYNLGLLWENGLGNTPKNTNQASLWYLNSAKQGFVPAMVRLANIQKTNGHEEAALSWYELAARWGNQDAAIALNAWGKAIPPADLLHKQQAKKSTNQQQSTEVWGAVGYLLGCTIGGGSCSQSQPISSSTARKQPRHTSSSSYSSNQECTSDFSCGTGHKCVKEPLNSSGVCMKSVNEYGVQNTNLPDPNSVNPNFNLEGECSLNQDCPIGFTCNSKYQVCIRN